MQKEKSTKIPAPPIRENYGWALLDRLRLIGQDNKELRRALHALLGFWPHDIECYRIAFAHRSAVYKNNTGRSLNNERLEFLGDAVLEAVVSDIVYHHFERKREGFLTGARAKLVQRATLNQLAESMGITRLLRVSSQPTTQHNNLGGNAFEALIGAIYLDRGYNHCYAFITRRVLGKYLNLDKLARTDENYKAKMLEWSQKNKLRIDFRLKTEENKGAKGNLFRSSVVVEGVAIAEGQGYSKKESHQNAARESLKLLQRNQRLRQSIFAAKEKRTAMEAEEYAALPGEDEGTDVAQMPDETAKKVAKTGEKTAETGEQTTKARKRRRRRKKPQPNGEQASATAPQTPTDEQ